MFNATRSPLMSSKLHNLPVKIFFVSPSRSLNQILDFILLDIYV